MEKLRLLSILCLFCCVNGKFQDSPDYIPDGLIPCNETDCIKPTGAYIKCSFNSIDTDKHERNYTGWIYKRDTYKCCPFLYSYTEHALDTTCIPYLEKRGCGVHPHHDKYLCREISSNSMSPKKKYEISCLDKTERCPTTCNDHDEGECKCFTGYYWCSLQKKCILDEEYCDCGPKKVKCDGNRCLNPHYVKPNDKQSKFIICPDGNCIKSIGEDDCIENQSTCQEGNWKCGMACLPEEHMKNQRACGDRCILQRSTCLKIDASTMKEREGVDTNVEIGDKTTTQSVFKTDVNGTTWTESSAPPLALIFGGSIGGILLAICLLLAVIFFKKKKRVQTNEDVELQVATQSRHISIPKSDDTKEILQRVLDYPWKIENDFQDIEEFASGLEKPMRQVRSKRRHNRHRDALPFDDNLITLSDPAGKPKTTYVNASPICFEDLDQMFISTQIPLQNSVENFWLMVLQKNVSVIVLLDSRSIEKFWPDKDGSLLKIKGNSITVRYLKHSFTGSFFRRKFAVVGGGEDRFIEMVHIHGWGDVVVPGTTKALLNVLYETEDIVEQSPGQIVTVCTNGSDRCGTFIALYKLIQDYRSSQKERLDVFGTVTSLRQQRQRMVGREEHLEFVLEGLHDFIIAQEIEYDESGEQDSRDKDHGQGSVAQEIGCTCRRIFTSAWEIVTSLWLLGDMSLDIRTTRFYHSKMMAGSLHRAYFIGSVVAHLAPVLGIVVMSWLYLAYVIRRPKRRHYVQTVIFTLLSPLIWVTTPFLALISALFGAMGIDTNSDHRVNDRGGRFRRFITYVMIVKAVEQFMEGLPQVVISSIYIDAHGVEDNVITLLSCVTSSGSLLFFISKHIYDIVNDFDRSILGLIAADRVNFP